MNLYEILAVKANKKLKQINDELIRGVYNTKTELETDFPSGTIGRYLVVDDGSWYYWNNTQWTSGGVYLSFDGGTF